MVWIVSSMTWIMLVSGALTCTMLYATFAPEAALRSTFGDGLPGPVAEIVVRNWGMLIGLIGGIIGPLLGALFVGLPVPQLYMWSAVPFAIGAVVTFILHMLNQGRLRAHPQLAMAQ